MSLARHPNLLLVIASLTLLLVLGNLPEEYVLDEFCLPQGRVNGIRAALHGSEFWEKQLVALRREQRGIEQIPVVRAQLRTVTDSLSRVTDHFLDSLRSAHPILQPSPEQRTVRELRAMADSIEHAGVQRLVDSVMAERWLALEACEQQLEQRSKPNA
jgi:hypothetical protein